MNLANDPEFALFVRRRERLNARLDASRARIDAWLEEHGDRQPTLVELARLEARLKTRRDALTELIALDNRLMEHLIRLRSQD